MRQNMNEADQFDEIDRRLLRALQADAALSHATLAERVGTSQASVWRRIRALEAAGVLGPAVRLVDPAKVGRGVSVICQLRMRSHALEERAKFENFVQTREEIAECFATSGEWDYLLRVVVRDVADYERFLMRDLLNHPTIAAAASHFALSQVKHTTAVPV
jgi:DNA-binding Lrp family transcriptional regulator